MPPLRMLNRDSCRDTVLLLPLPAPTPGTPAVPYCIPSVPSPGRPLVYRWDLPLVSQQLLVGHGVALAGPGAGSLAPRAPWPVPAGPWAPPTGLASGARGGVGLPESEFPGAPGPTPALPPCLQRRARACCRY